MAEWSQLWGIVGTDGKTEIEENSQPRKSKEKRRSPGADHSSLQGIPFGHKDPLITSSLFPTIPQGHCPYKSL